jgi:hypothetical protein
LKWISVSKFYIQKTDGKLIGTAAKSLINGKLVEERKNTLGLTATIADQT